MVVIEVVRNNIKELTPQEMEVSQLDKNLGLRFYTIHQKAFLFFRFKAEK